ncbi:MAG: Na+/H+ antiporter subunit E [Yonghaparkia sp.]|nr:Na+/H+ antiporter subunit E [Microcella sp.]
MTRPWSLPLRAVIFALWFSWQVVVTSLRVSALILTPGRQPRPGIVRVPIRDLSDGELTLLVALVTITPDTLVIAIDRDAGIMHVHGMFVDGDPEAFRAAVRGMEWRMLRGIRRRPPSVEEVAS